MSSIVEQHPIAVLGFTFAVIVIGGLLVGTVAAFGRSLKVDVMGVHAELKPNGGSSMRDAVDRIERKADSAVKRADIAATQATVAADKAAEALERIERLEQQRPSATAIVVNPPPEHGG